MNNPEMTMHEIGIKNRFEAQENAIEAASIAIALAMRVPAPLRSIADQIVRSATIHVTRGRSDRRVRATPAINIQDGFSDEPATIPGTDTQNGGSMFKKILALTVMSLAALSAAAQEVYVDYDRSGRFSWYKTWAWADAGDASLEGRNDLLHSKITNAIENNLGKGRLVKDPEDPQLYVTYYAGSRQAVKVDPVGFGVGFGGSWVTNPYWGGVGVSTATARTYEQGTLVIDIWEAESKKLVWRGVAIDVFFDDPKKTDKKINKAIEKMITKWRKMKPGL